MGTNEDADDEDGIPGDVVGGNSGVCAAPVGVNEVGDDDNETAFFRTLLSAAPLGENDEPRARLIGAITDEVGVVANRFGDDADGGVVTPLPDMVRVI